MVKIVLSDEFEWRSEGSEKQNVRISGGKSRELAILAGLWRIAQWWAWVEEEQALVKLEEDGHSD